MAESTQSYSFADLYQDVQEYQGVGRTNSDPIATAKRRVNDAYRKFIQAFDWIFLKPFKVLTLQADVEIYELPDNFQGFEMPFKYPSDLIGYPMNEKPIEYIMNLKGQAGSSTGRPYYFALRPTVYNEQEGTRWEVIFYPKPDDTYQLTYRYKIAVDELVNDDDIAAGQPLHSATLRAFCLAEVELFDDEGSRQHWKRELYGEPYLRRKGLLDKSIELDRRFHPRNIGKMTNMEDWFQIKRWNANDGITNNQTG